MTFKFTAAQRGRLRVGLSLPASHRRSRNEHDVDSGSELRLTRTVTVHQEPGPGRVVTPAGHFYIERFAVYCS